MAIVILIYVFFTIIVFSYSFPKNSINNNIYISYLSIFIIMCISMYSIIITDIFYTDRIVYTRIFNESLYLSFFEQLKVTDLEPLYILFTNIVSYFTNNVMVFYFLLHLLFLISIVQGLKKIGDIYYVGYSLFMLVNAFFYYGYTLNGLRQGIAIALLILILGLLVKQKYLRALSISIASVLIHYTALPIILLTFFIYYFQKYIKLKALFVLYLVMSILFIFDLQPFLVGFLESSYIDRYTSANILENFGETNNINFLIFNSFFLIIFYSIYNKYFVNDKIYIFLFQNYMVYSTFFLLFGFIAFSNRIAAYSWFLIPIILAYYLNRENSIVIKFMILFGIMFIGFLTGVFDVFST